MLIGEYKGKLTEKNRIAIPKKFRVKLEDKIYITRGYERCLIVLDENRWNNLIKNIEIKPFLNRSVRDTKRFILGGAEEINWDSQGRFVIPESLTTYAEIEKEVIFVGISDWLEVWDNQKWETKLADLTESAGEIAERLADNN
ncbi:division/cell wall cluster transcriptional repressor MraZ [Candidatus Dojkabacteria bacterium]|nr:division/cell wall cluster transcriptional repressor MraZ [Candidatus Dojkabacteria bacterium]